MGLDAVAHAALTLPAPPQASRPRVGRWSEGEEAQLIAKKSHPGAVSLSQKGPAASAPRPRAPTKTRPSKRRKVTTRPAEQLAPLSVGSTAVAGGDDGGSDAEEAEILRLAAQPLGARHHIVRA